MSIRHHRRCNSFSDDSEEACRTQTDPGPEAEPEELDWDGYSTTLEHKLASVGKPGYYLIPLHSKNALLGNNTSFLLHCYQTLGIRVYVCVSGIQSPAHKLL